MADEPTREGEDGGLPDNFVVEGETMTIPLHAGEAEALRLQAEEHTGAGEFDVALGLLARAQRLNPLSVDVHFDRAVALHFKGEDAEALDVLDAMARVLVMPDALMVLVHQLRGDALRDLGRPEEALAAYDASLAMGPGPRYVLRPLQQRALLLAELGRAEEAIEACDALLARAPDDPPILALRARLSATSPRKG